jgi:hypothetical protein
MHPPALNHNAQDWHHRVPIGCGPIEYAIGVLHRVDDQPDWSDTFGHHRSSPALKPTGTPVFELGNWAECLISSVAHRR